MVVILIIATLISAALGNLNDAVVILAIVVLNAILGFSPEYRAEHAMAALKRLAVPTVKARRAGHIQELAARDLLPGDIVLLEAGNRVPANGWVLESVNLRIQEAALSGESEPVDKVAHALAETELPLGDRRNMAYLGMLVTCGRGQIVVTATGIRTELGAIAALIQTIDHGPTPLQRRLDQLGRTLAGVREWLHDDSCRNTPRSARPHPGWRRPGDRRRDLCPGAAGQRRARADVSDRSRHGRCRGSLCGGRRPIPIAPAKVA